MILCQYEANGTITVNYAKLKHLRLAEASDFQHVVLSILNILRMCCCVENTEVEERENRS